MKSLKKSIKTNVINVAILTAMVTPGIASADAEIFGKVHLSAGSLSQDDGTTSTSSTAIASHASRVGVKGTVDTDSDISVIYRFVWQIDMTDESKSSKDHIKSREQYVGLKGDWGQVRIGRDDSPYKLAGKKNVEHLSDTYADYNNIIDKGQDTRNNNSIGYIGKVGPGKFALQYAAGDDSVSAENAGQSYSVAYDMKMGDLGFAVSYQNIEKTSVNNEIGTKLVFGYKIANTKLGLIGEVVEDDATLDDTNVLFSAKHNFDKNNALKFVYGFKDQGKANDATMTALAFDHKLGKKVSVYALWTDGADGGLNDATKLSGDGSAIALGLIAKF